jgi:xanthine dehydrogenase YagS FAD-binding subunit
MIPRIAYSRPRTLRQAITELSIPGTILHAGGTDLLGCLRDGIVRNDRIVSISALPGLRGIARTKDGGLRIGGLTTLAEVAADPLVREQYTALAQGAESAASPQLRNQGTLGGNLCQRPRCWYFRGDFHCLRKGGNMCYAVGGQNEYHCIFGGENCFIVHPSDTASPLVALGGSVRIAGPHGTKTVPLDAFFVGPATDIRRENILVQGEILTEILLPAPAAVLRSSYRKVRGRGAWDFALAGVALALRLRGDRVELARVVLSGVAPVPWRAGQAEKALAGRAVDEETAHLAASAAVQDAQPLANNAYKRDLVRGIVAESLMALGRV